MRTVTTEAIFTRPFLLPGFDAPHAPGTFKVETDEERLDTSFEAWRRVRTSILIVDGGSTSSWSVDPRALAAALEADAA